ncbi:NAD(P)-binding protein [Auricularia subglabra TFB-10046 SS5]|nr:NAD(P)-binding protein [Auricularia subglabra TFB-10046 SS5]
MSNAVNERFLYQAVPNGIPVPGVTTRVDTSTTIDLANVPLHGGFLRELVAFGIEAHIRLRMQSAKTAISGVSTVPLRPGEPLVSQAVCKIVRSEHPKYPAGTYVRHDATTLEKYAVVDVSEVAAWEKLDNPSNMPWSKFMGGAGMPGRTAYYGYRRLTDPTNLMPAKKGETIFISTAAGPHGSLLVQLFNQLGLKVIGSAGSREKVDYLKSLGCDVAFNYKEEDVSDVLKREGPIDIYWDNAGGDALEAAVSNMNKFGRVIICGWTSNYSADTKPTLRNLGLVMYKSITIHGFYYDHLSKWYEEGFQKQFLPRIASGELQYKECIVHGMKNAEQALADVLTGANFGKTVVVL